MNIEFIEGLKHYLLSSMGIKGFDVVIKKLYQS
jgi:hypothetical protein